MKKSNPQFQIVRNYLESIGVGTAVVLHSMFFNHPTKPTVCINKRYNLEKNGLYIYLHEAGHALQPKENVGVNAYKNIDVDETPSKTKEFNMLMFMNEVDAWNRGEQLAKDLGLVIDWKAFNKIKNECLLTYFTN